MTLKPIGDIVPKLSLLKSPKIMPFSRGTFFIESKAIVKILPKISEKALKLRILLSIWAQNRAGTRTTQASILKIAETLGYSAETIRRAGRELERLGLVERKGKTWTLKEPSKPGTKPFEPGSGRPEPGQLLFNFHPSPHENARL